MLTINFHHRLLAALAPWLLASVMACGDGSPLNGLFGKKRDAAPAASENEREDETDDSGEEEDKPAAAPAVWPSVTIINDEDFRYGIPNGDLEIKFQAQVPEGFELRCRAAPAEDIGEAEKESCETSFEIGDYKKNRDYRFEVFAVHGESETEREIITTDFRTDPILIIVPEEPFIKTQYSGTSYATLTATTSLPVYFTCSTTSELVWDPTHDCREGKLFLDYARYNGAVRMRLLAWSLTSNKLLAKRDLFFCSGFRCVREIGPVSPPPY